MSEEIKFPKPRVIEKQYVAIRYGAQRPIYRKIIYKEAITPFQCINLGSVSAGASIQSTAIVSLDMPVGELAQVRFAPLDFVQYRLWLPTGTAMGQLKNFQSYFDMSIYNWDAELESTEKFLWEDNHPGVSVINGLPVTVPASRLKAFGWRFVTDELPQNVIDSIVNGNTPCAEIWTSGFAIGNKN